LIVTEYCFVTTMTTFKIIEANVSAETTRFIEEVSSADLFDNREPVVVTRAPGRLDVMGGIADYSGSLVLQLPIADATYVALQKSASKSLRIVSQNESTAPRAFEFDPTKFNGPISYEAARHLFADAENHWAAYVAGVFLVLMREKNARFEEGAALLIHSSVPEGKGVASSAALEVAVMQAVAVAFGIEMDCRELATLCQKVENLVAGAPCGIMDQMTSSCGEENRLLELLCQPDQLLGALTIPPELELWGVDSGVRHAVSGSDYTTVRTAAFMGYRIISDLAGLRVDPNNAGKVSIEDPSWKGYLANIKPVKFKQSYPGALPEIMKGDDFLSRYQGITDTVTSVQPEREYPVRQSTTHAVYENARVQSFAAMLKNWQGIERAPDLGQLMFESHRSYSDCGLGAEATDLIVDLVRNSADDGLFGARITGGGSGGTVAILAHASARATIKNLAMRFSEQTGYTPIIFSGSSPGACKFGHVRLKI
jgi:L-arabinokinase